MIEAWVLSIVATCGDLTVNNPFCGSYKVGAKISGRLKNTRDFCNDTFRRRRAMVRHNEIRSIFSQLNRL